MRAFCAFVIVAAFFLLVWMATFLPEWVLLDAAIVCFFYWCWTLVYTLLGRVR